MGSALETLIGTGMVIGGAAVDSLSYVALNYESIEKDFLEKKLHPLDLKNALADELIEILKPIHKHRKELEMLAKKAYD